MTQNNTHTWPHIATEIACDLYERLYPPPNGELTIIYLHDCNNTIIATQTGPTINRHTYHTAIKATNHQHTITIHPEPDHITIKRRQHVTHHSTINKTIAQYDYHDPHLFQKITNHIKQTMGW